MQTVEKNSEHLTFTFYIVIMWLFRIYSGTQDKSLLCDKLLNNILIINGYLGCYITVNEALCFLSGSMGFFLPDVNKLFSLWAHCYSITISLSHCTLLEKHFSLYITISKYSKWVHKMLFCSARIHFSARMLKIYTKMLKSVNWINIYNICTIRTISALLTQAQQKSHDREKHWLEAPKIFGEVQLRKKQINEKNELLLIFRIKQNNKLHTCMKVVETYETFCHSLAFASWLSGCFHPDSKHILWLLYYTPKGENNA